MRLVKISDIGKVVTGKTPKTSVESYFGGDIPFITPSDMDGRKFIDNTARYLTHEGAASVKNCVIPAGTIMVSCIGSDMGKTHISPRKAVTNQQINSILVNEAHASSDYIYYNLFGRRAEIRNLAAGSSAQPILNKSNFSEIEILLPPMEEQREIASILGALDDKIELNRRMSATLEEMARSLYRSWFVDFDPVLAKMEGRQPAFMDEATAALFPGRFGENGLPEGWESGCISDIAKLNPEKHTKKKHPNTVEYVDLSNTKWGLIELTTRYSWEEAPSRARMVLREQDTIVGTVRPGNGSYSYIGKDGLTGSTGFAVLRPMDPSDVALVYLSATDTDTIDALTNLADGGAYPAVRPDVVATQRVVLADDDVRTAFQESVSPMIAKIEASKTENQTLATLRDSLLPKLMSGEIRVGEAREQVEDVV
jgi:type I restriction enzyme S subunit